MDRIEYYVKRILFRQKVLKETIVTTSPQLLLEGKTILITGGSSGIGYAMAELFLKSGATVIISARNNKKLDSAYKRLSSLSAKIHKLQLDITEIDSFSKFIIDAELLTQSKINVLVNNAGIAKGNFDNLKEEDFNQVYETNVKGTVFLSKAFADYMIINNIKGNILNVISTSGIRPALSPYEISKWGLKGFTLGLAKKLIKNGIVVNGIAPGPTAAPMLKSEDDDNMYHPTTPSGRYTTPEEVANAALFLISDMGRQIVGDILYISGGAGITTYDDITY